MRLRNAAESISESYELCLEDSFSKLATKGAMEERVEEVFSRRRFVDCCVSIARNSFHIDRCAIVNPASFDSSLRACYTLGYSMSPSQTNLFSILNQGLFSTNFQTHARRDCPPLPNRSSTLTTQCFRNRVEGQMNPYTHRVFPASSITAASTPAATWLMKSRFNVSIVSVGWW